jgi:hypothetical protein
MTVTDTVPAIRVVKTKPNSSYGEIQKKNYVKNRAYNLQRMATYYQENKVSIRKKRMDRYYAKRAALALTAAA